MIIDAHQHCFWHGRDDAGLIADLDEHHIDQAWLLTWETPPQENATPYLHVFNPIHVRADGTHAGMPLSDVLATHRKYPGRFLPGYCPHPLAGDAPRFFESACRIHGVRVCGEWKFRVLFDDPRCLELHRKAGELGCPVVLHLDVPYLRNETSGQLEYCPEWYGGTADNLERALQACPQTNFLGHAPGFWREISGDAGDSPKLYPDGPITPGGKVWRLLKEYPNLYGDMSGFSGRNAISRSPEIGRDFICTFANRLLFARDEYGGKTQAFLATLNLPSDVQEQVFFGNAQRLIRP